MRTFVTLGVKDSAQEKDLGRVNRSESRQSGNVMAQSGGEQSDAGMVSPTSTPTRSPSVHLPLGLTLKGITRPSWEAYGEWVVGQVVYQRFLDRHADATTFVPLSCQFTHRYIPKNVRRTLLENLIAHGVLECKRTYHFDPRGITPGECMRYRLGDSFRQMKIGARPITHRELLRKIMIARAAERDEITHPVHIGLRKWHDQVVVVPGAPTGEVGHPLLDRMIEGERRFTVCKQGRVHTNIANLPGSCRQYIRLDGQELASVDISTSQPLILGLYLTGRTGSFRSRERSHPSPESARSHPGRRMARQSRSEEGTIPSLSTSSDHSLNVYLQDCLGGEVYDKIAAVTGYTRNEVKPLFLAVIYGDPQNMHTKVGEAICELYPAVFDAVIDLAYTLGHGGLPRLMQRIESDIMILGVAARLMSEEPHMPLLTVHDSIVVPPVYVVLAQRAIAEQWQAEFGLKPRTKVTMFTASQEPRTSAEKR